MANNTGKYLAVTSTYMTAAVKFQGRLELKSIEVVYSEGDKCGFLECIE